MQKEKPFTTHLADLLQTLVTQFIFYPANLEIKAGGIGRIVSIAWRGHRADTSRMIGERGETYRALAKLFTLIGNRHGYDVELDRVGQPEVGAIERYEPFKANPEWPRTRILASLTSAVDLAAGQHQITAADIGDTKTAIEVSIARTESLNTETVLRESLKHIFKVIGNANGRVIIVDVRRNMEPDQQPATADGRWTKAARK